MEAQAHETLTLVEFEVLLSTVEWLGVIDNFPTIVWCADVFVWCPA